MSFYRTYRPQVIAEIDNVAVKHQLLSLLSKDKKSLPHAYLFAGPKGTGKTTAARIIAKLFNCDKPGKDGPCGVCPSCKAITSGTHVDVLEIDAASNRGIDDVRELRERIKLAPAMGSFKIYIIDEVHMMTTEAFNALLKTLEEPPAHAVFILATTDPQKVPVTVRSRCMEIVFAKAKEEELQSALSRILQKEKITIDDAALAVIAQTADGAFRDAVKLLEQASFHTGPIDKTTILQLLSKGDEATRTQMLDFVLTDRDASGAIRCIEEYVAAGGDIKVFTTDCLSDIQSALIEAVHHGPCKWDIQSMQNFSRLLIETFTQLRQTPIPQLPLELAVLEFTASSKRSMSVKEENHHTPLVAQHTTPEKKQSSASTHAQPDPSDCLNLEKLTAHWSDYIEALKPYNHSVAGVVRGARPKSVEGDLVTIEAFYSFHQERLSDPKVRDILACVLKKLFGVPVKVQIVLGKK